MLWYMIPQYPIINDEPYKLKVLAASRASATRTKKLPSDLPPRYEKNGDVYRVGIFMFVTVRLFFSVKVPRIYFLAVGFSFFVPQLRKYFSDVYTNSYVGSSPLNHHERTNFSSYL